MAYKTDAELTVLAEQIRDEIAVNGNTKTRVYNILKDLIDSKPNPSSGGGAMIFLGNWDASSNTFPSVTGSGPAGAILKGNTWRISVAGAPGSLSLEPGTLIMALIDAPGQTLANWTTL
jgi:hypothetical protein